MGSTYQIQIVTIQELAYDICTEGERDTSVILSPALDVFIGIRPKQVA